MMPGEMIVIGMLALMGIGISLFVLGAFWLLSDAVRCEYR